jgi:uncharacterized membrane protein
MADPPIQQDAGESGPRGQYRHPVNRILLDEAPFRARLADAVVHFLGSWTFIVIQTVVVIAWVAGNVALLLRFDPYPFILLNLAFSTQAAYAAPLILLASNRAAASDRLTLEHAAAQADVEEQQNEELLDRSRQLTGQIARLEAVIARLEGVLEGDGPGGEAPHAGREPGGAHDGSTPGGEATR